MNFTASFLALLAAAQNIIAFPYLSQDSEVWLNILKFACTVPVTKLVCDGNSYKCTASLDFGDGKWVAQWNTAVFHTGLFGSPDHKATVQNMVLVPVPVSKLVCDGNTYKCTADLKFGDGKWVAQWSTNVFHQGFTSGEVSAMAPVPVTKFVCDGKSYKCTADLEFGDGRWAAQWATDVFHTNNFLQQN